MLANVGIIGTVGYFAYTNWDRPHWDRRTLSAISVGLLTLWGGEGSVLFFCGSSSHNLTAFFDHVVTSLSRFARARFNRQGPKLV